MYYRHICDVCVDGVREGDSKRGKETKDAARRPFKVEIIAAFDVTCPHGNAHIVYKQAYEGISIVNWRGD